MACAFYMTYYATKSYLSTHQMVPLIAASVAKVDSSSSVSIMEISKQIILSQQKALNVNSPELDFYIRNMGTNSLKKACSRIKDLLIPTY